MYLNCELGQMGNKVIQGIFLSSLSRLAGTGAPEYIKDSFSVSLTEL